MYDVIFDCIGNQPYAACKHVLRGRRVHVTVRPVIDKTYPLAEIAAAQEYSKAGRAKGKIVLEV